MRWMVIALLGAIPAVTFGSDDSAALIARLERRVQEQPDDATAWRLLGRVRERNGDRDDAFQAFARSVELDPTSAAAHFDLARLALEAGDTSKAATHFAEAVRLAPDSLYAEKARESLKELPNPEETIQRVGFEVRRFDRTELIPGLGPASARLRDARLESEPENLPPPLSFRLEMGALYNTNVALAPTSRELSSAARESFQFFASPELEYAFVNTPNWRAGPTFRGYFSFNTDHELQALNLQSLQPGFFAERLIDFEPAILLPRVAYSFTHDTFDGDDFADRHALSLSSTIVWRNLSESNVYWVTDYTKYADPGEDPSITSRDGWTTTLGASHRVYLERRWLQSISAGMEAQRAETEGQNFRYNGAGVYGDAEVPVLENLTLVVNAGVTRRIYPDADLDPSRDEWVFHAGGRLRWDITPNWSAATVLSYDRFDADNEMFRANRMIGGVTTTFQY